MSERLLLSLCEQVLQGTLPLEDALRQVRVFTPVPLLGGFGPSIPDHFRRLPGDVTASEMQQTFGMPPAAATLPSVVVAGSHFSEQDFAVLDNLYTKFAVAGQRQQAGVLAELAMEAAHCVNNRQFEAYFALQLAGCIGHAYGAERTEGALDHVSRRMHLCRFAAGALEEAATSNQQVRPLAAQAHMRLGIALGDAGRREEAIGCLRRAAQLLEGTDATQVQAQALNNLGYSLLQIYKLRLSTSQEFVVSTFDQQGALKDASLHGGHEEHLETVRGTAEPTLREAVAALRQSLALHRQIGNFGQIRSTEINLAEAAGHLADLLLHGRSATAPNWDEIAELFELHLTGEAPVFPAGHPHTVYWALGQAYGLKTTGDRQENHRRAVEYFRRAQERIDGWEIHADLGDLHSLQGDWVAACAAYDRAHERFSPQAGGFPIQGWDTGTPVTASFYPRHARACARLGRADEALAHAARAKARILAQRLELADSRPSSRVPETLVAELASLREQLRRGSWSEPDTSPRQDTLSWVRRDQQLDRLKEQERDLLKQIALHDPQFTADVQGMGLDWQELRSLLEPADILVELLLDEDFLLAFVATHDRVAGPEVLLFEGVGERDIRRLIIEAVHKGAAPGEDLAALSLERQYEIWPTVLEQILPELGGLIFGSRSITGRCLADVLEEQRSRLATADSGRLILIPHGPLHNLPLHACPYPGGDPERLADAFVVSTAPSTTMWAQARRRVRSLDRLCAYGDPDGTLPGARLEVNCVRAFFAADDQFVFAPGQVGKTDFLQRVGSASVIHIAGHAVHDIRDFRESRLLLSDGAVSLKEVLATLRTDQAGLVVLSACETGIAPTGAMRDEGLNFAGAFLHAGARWVIAAGWKVDDWATCLLMTRLYQLLLGGEADTPPTPPVALASAQRWLRSLTEEAALQHLLTLDSSSGLADRFRQRQRGLIAVANRPRESRPTARPFTHPIYWAGFSCAGA